MHCDGLSPILAPTRPAENDQRKLEFQHGRLEQSLKGDLRDDTTKPVSMRYPHPHRKARTKPSLFMFPTQNLILAQHDRRWVGRVAGNVPQAGQWLAFLDS